MNKTIGALPEIHSIKKHFNRRHSNEDKCRNYTDHAAPRDPIIPKQANSIKIHTMHQAPTYRLCPIHVRILCIFSLCFLHFTKNIVSHAKVQKIFKRPNMLKPQSDKSNTHKKIKSKFKKSKNKSHSESNLLLKPANLKKQIDKKLIKTYQECVEQRVQMLRSRAFPNDVLHQLPQYRADLSYVCRV